LSSVDPALLLNKRNNVFTMLLKIGIKLIQCEKFSIKELNAIFNLFLIEQVPPKWIILNSIGIMMSFNFMDLSNILNFMAKW